jgi:hypothetical protein
MAKHRMPAYHSIYSVQTKQTGIKQCRLPQTGRMPFPTGKRSDKTMTVMVSTISLNKWA